jgi:hypothetical protein
MFLSAKCDWPGGQAHLTHDARRLTSGALADAPLGPQRLRFFFIAGNGSLTYLRRNGSNRELMVAHAHYLVCDAVCLMLKRSSRTMGFVCITP